MPSIFIARPAAIARIREGLQQRSGSQWSVKGGRGTAWGWIYVTAPPARRVYDLDGVTIAHPPGEGYMSMADRQRLGELLGLPGPVPREGVSIPAAGDYRTEYVDRAEGRTPSVLGEPYWD